MRKITVAGAGHGGLVAAALLAKEGYDVTIYEKNQRDEIGYDWEDCCSASTFAKIGMTEPTAEDFRRLGDVAYINPNRSTPLVAKHGDNGYLTIERKRLYDCLFSFAQESGVKLEFGVRIFGSITENGRVTGIKTDRGNIFSDLVIDAAGVNSTVRITLPDECRVPQMWKCGEVFYAYRAYFNKVEGFPEPAAMYEIFLDHEHKRGISWCITDDDHTDILIGRFRPLTDATIIKTMDKFREYRPQVGTKLLRGGSWAPIPVRKVSSQYVCDGYAAIGDSAYMTVPMCGSGIDICILQGKALADVILAAGDDAYTTQNLWKYQYDFVTGEAKGLASLDVLKNSLMMLDPHDIDFLFEKRIITIDDILATGMGTSFTDLAGRGLRGLAKITVLLSVVSALNKGDKLAKIFSELPEEYDFEKVEAWKQAVDAAAVPLTETD